MAILRVSWIQVLQQATADSVTSFMCLVISLPAAAGNRRLFASPVAVENTEYWEGWCLHALLSLLFLTRFSQQKYPEELTNKGHLVTQTNGLARFVKSQR